MADEPGSVAAGTFYACAPNGAEGLRLRPTQQPLVTPPRGRYLQLAQASAQAVQGYGHVQIEMGVHPKDHLLRAVRPVHANDRSHVRPSFRDRHHHYRPGEAENGRHCDGSRQRQALIRSRCSGRGRPRSDAPDRSTGHSQGTQGPRIDGSDRAEASPATTYSVFTADRSIARRAQIAVALGHYYRAATSALDKRCLLIEVRQGKTHQTRGRKVVGEKLVRPFSPLSPLRASHPSQRWHGRSSLA